MLWGLLEYLSSILFFFLHITSAGSFPKALTAAEEKKYLEQMAAGDHHARQKLIEHNLRLVAHIAKKYYADENDRDDLVSIGTVGSSRLWTASTRQRAFGFRATLRGSIENEILMFFRQREKDSAGLLAERPHRYRQGRQHADAARHHRDGRPHFGGHRPAHESAAVVRRGEDPSFAARARDHFAALRAYGPAAACAARGRKKAEHFPQLCLAP